jgi:type IV pilus assembly protein PilC
MLAEVFAELEQYYNRQRKLWQQFVGQSIWPIIQFVLATFVLAGLILIMGLIATSRGDQPLDPLGLGLHGPTGALIFLGVVYGLVAALVGIYLLLMRSAQRSVAVKTALLSVPALGPCLQALALTRFCMALRLTTETGMSILEAMHLSLRATGNQAFVARGEEIDAQLRRGRELTRALSSSRLFPEVFLQMIEVAEESGKLDQVLAHQAKHYHEKAGRRLTALTSLAASGIWVFVAIVIIVAIFRIATWYIGLLG